MDKDQALFQTKISDWKEVSKYFSDADIKRLLDDKERDSIEFLLSFWRDSEFNPSECQPKIDYLKECDKLHPNNREIIEKSKKLRGLAQTFYTKDIETFKQFREALGWKPTPKPTPTPTPKQTPTPNSPHSDEAMMLLRAEKWVKAYQFLKSEEIIRLLDTQEYTAIEMLGKMWREKRYTIALKEQAEEFIQVLIDSQKLHNNNRDIIEHTKNISSVARYIYSSAEAFMAFQTFTAEYIKKHTPQQKPTPKVPIYERKNEPLVISDVVFANIVNGQVKGGWGTTLQQNIYRISPKLKVTSNFHGTKVVEVVMRYSDGETDTYTDKVEFSGVGEYRLSDWGNDKGGAFLTYTYIDYAINIDKKCVWRGRVTLKGSIPTSPTITTVEFGEGDKDGKILTEFGRPLPKNMKFLQPRIVVSNNYYGKVKVTVKLKSDHRPDAQWDYDVSINGEGRYPILGYGNQDGTYFNVDEHLSVSISVNGREVWSGKVKIGNGGTGSNDYNRQQQQQQQQRQQQQRQQQRQQQQRSYNHTPPPSTKSGWQRYDAFIRSIGEWFEEHTDLLSTILNGLIFVAYVIAVIATWISEGFWEALLTGVIGFFITGLAIWGTTIVTNIVSWILSNIVFRNGWLFLIVLALFIISNMSWISNIGDFGDDYYFEQAEVEQYNYDDTETYYCKANSLNVRIAPSTSAAVIGTIKKNQAIEVYDIQNGFARIDYYGSVGYVSADWISAY